VEVDLFQRHAMHGCLGLCEPAEDAKSQVALFSCETAALQDLLDLGQKAMAVFLRRLDAHVGGREPTLPHLLDFQLNGQAERTNPLPDRLGIDAAIDEGGQRHVTADAAETVEMSRFHCEEFPSALNAAAAVAWLPAPGSAPEPQPAPLPLA